MFGRSSKRPRTCRHFLDVQTNAKSEKRAENPCFAITTTQNWLKDWYLFAKRLLFSFENFSPVVARTWLESKSVFFLGKKIQILARKSQRAGPLGWTKSPLCQIFREDGDLHCLFQESPFSASMIEHRGMEGGGGIVVGGGVAKVWWQRWGGVT